MAVLLGIWNRVRGWVITLGATLAFVALVYARGARSGKNAAENRELKDDLEEARKTTEAVVERQKERLDQIRRAEDAASRVRVEGSDSGGADAGVDSVRPQDDPYRRR